MLRDPAKEGLSHLVAHRETRAHAQSPSLVRGEDGGGRAGRLRCVVQLGPPGPHRLRRGGFARRAEVDVALGLTQDSSADAAELRSDWAEVAFRSKRILREGATGGKEEGVSTMGAVFWRHRIGFGRDHLWRAVSRVQCD